MIKPDLYKFVIPCGNDKSLDGEPKGKKPFRYYVAEEEKKGMVKLPSEVIRYVNEYLALIGMKPTCFKYEITKNQKRKIPYCEIKEKYKTKDKKDLVWIKFTKRGYVGAVCASNDVNFRYDNTSGRIIAHVKQKWNESFVLLVPLSDIPLGLDRRTIESGIGNYLISKGVPILDYYSHNL